MKEKINIEEYVQFVRKRPGMYIGSMDIKGFKSYLLSLLSEVFSRTQSDFVRIDFDQDKSAKIVFENIVGSFEDDIMCSLSIINDVHKMGFVVLNALSAQLTFLAFKKEELVLEQVFQKGAFVKGKVENKSIDADKIELHFELDAEMWKQGFRWNHIYLVEELKRFAYLYKDTKFKINYPFRKEVCNILFQFENGLKDRLQLEKFNGAGTTYFDTYFEEKFEGFSIEVAFAFRKLSVDESSILSFVNDHRTYENGTHVDGLLKGLTLGIMKHFQKYELVNDYKISEKGVRESLIAVLNIRMKEAYYSGCVKNKLASSQVIEPISKYVSELLFEKMEKDKDASESMTQKFKIF